MHVRPLVVVCAVGLLVVAGSAVARPSAVPTAQLALMPLPLSAYGPDAVGLTLDTKFDRDHTLNALFRCDHLPFLLAEVPAIWLFGGFHPGYHEPSDTVEKLNFTKMEKVIQLAYAAALELANAPTPPRFSAQ